MDETTLISTIVSRLDSALSVPVQTNVGEDRKFPVVLVDDWSTTDLTHHNTAKAYEEYGDFDGDGTNEYAKWLRFYFDTRVDITVRAEDDVKASKLKDKVKHEIYLISENPQQFHADLNTCTPRSSGNPSTKFTEPEVTEEGVGAMFSGFYQIVQDNFDTIEQVKDTFTINE